MITFDNNFELSIKFDNLEWNAFLGIHLRKNWIESLREVSLKEIKEKKEETFNNVNYHLLHGKCTCFCVFKHMEKDCLFFGGPPRVRRTTPELVLNR